MVLVIPLALLFATNPIVTWAGLLPRLTSLRRLREAIRPPPLAFAVPTLPRFSRPRRNTPDSHPTARVFLVLTAIQWAYEKPAPTYLHAWFIAYGPIIALALYDWRRLSSFLRGNQFMLTYLLSFAILGWMAGSDTERIHWACSLVRADRKGSGGHLRFNQGMAAGYDSHLESAGHRGFSGLFQYSSDHPTPLPILTIPSSRFQFLDLFSVHAERTIEAVSLVQYLVLCALVLWYMGDMAKSGHA